MVRHRRAGAGDVVDDVVTLEPSPAVELKALEPPDVHPARANATSRLSAIRIMHRGYADRVRLVGLIAFRSWLPSVSRRGGEWGSRLGP